MNIPDYFGNIDAAVTICDREGILVYMNDAADRVFSARGGRKLLGSNLMACHSPASQEKIREMLATGSSNAYTIEKNGVRKMIWQGPWRDGEEIAGLIEISVILPDQLPHYIR
jgi:transcriptional regulator with PAS, ATPase and Fis domain